MHKTKNIPSNNSQFITRHLQKELNFAPIHNKLNQQPESNQLGSVAPLGHQFANITIQPKKENKTGLPNKLKAGIENLSSLSLDDVKVHYNSPKPAQVGALAYTQGSEIHVAPNQETHLAHEAWHVTQQKQGRVQPTGQVAGLPINDDSGLEAEASKMGSKALQLKKETSPNNFSPAQTKAFPLIMHQLSNAGEFGHNLTRFTIQRVQIGANALQDNNVATDKTTVKNVKEEDFTIGNTKGTVHFHANNYFQATRNLTSITATFSYAYGWSDETNKYHVTMDEQANGSWAVTLNEGHDKLKTEMVQILQDKKDSIV